MLPDRAKFYDSLKNYNSLQHVKNSMYGLEYDEHSYYKREGEPGNYRYYWTKQEYEAHLAELENQRKKNMQAAQNAEADRWKRNNQNKMTQQQIKNNSQANTEADRWKRQQENQEKEKQRLETIKKNATAAQHEGDRYNRYKQEKQQQETIKKNQEAAQHEGDRFEKKNKPLTRKTTADIAREQTNKEYQHKKEIEKLQENIKKNAGNNPEADRWKRNDENKVNEAKEKSEAEEARLKEENKKKEEYQQKENDILEKHKSQVSNDANYYDGQRNERNNRIDKKEVEARSLRQSNNVSGEDFNKKCQEMGKTNLKIDKDGKVTYNDTSAIAEINRKNNLGSSLYQDYENYMKKYNSATDPDEKLRYLENANTAFKNAPNNMHEAELMELDLEEKAYDEYIEVMNEIKKKGK